MLRQRASSPLPAYSMLGKKVQGGNMTGTVRNTVLLAIVITMAISRPANTEPKEDDRSYLPPGMRTGQPQTKEAERQPAAASTDQPSADQKERPKRQHRRQRRDDFGRGLFDLFD
jgi:hypothetical protein